MNELNRGEQAVRAYFEARPGWTVSKLDIGNNRAADFRICNHGDCFLCEVKTISSVKANFPHKPIESYLEQRRERQAEIQKWQEENSGSGRQLVLVPGDWEFIFGDEAEFIAKYKNRRRNTEEWFEKFARELKLQLTNSEISELPYRVRLDSDDLYVPSRKERGAFVEWLVTEIGKIHDGRTSRQWHIAQPLYGQTPVYSSFYPIHETGHEHDFNSEYQLTVERRADGGSLEIDIHSYGGLNLDAITSAVRNAVDQLAQSAMRETEEKVPQVIALAFEKSLGPDDWDALTNHVTWLLKNHTRLSAIAVLEWIPDGIPPPREDGFWAWIEFQMNTPRALRFVVFHNRWLHDVSPLLPSAFVDKWSLQLSPLG